jgi:hypothetical protein
MLNKGNLDIPKLMWTIMNQTVMIMEIVELDISLTKGARLDVGLPNYSMITEKLMKNIAISIESYLMLKHWSDGHYCDIRIAPGRSPQNNP